MTAMMSATLYASPRTLFQEQPHIEHTVCILQYLTARPLFIVFAQCVHVKTVDLQLPGRFTASSAVARCCPRSCVCSLPQCCGAQLLLMSSVQPSSAYSKGYCCHRVHRLNMIASQTLTDCSQAPAMLFELQCTAIRCRCHSCCCCHHHCCYCCCYCCCCCLLLLRYRPLMRRSTAAFTSPRADTSALTLAALSEKPIALSCPSCAAYDSSGLAGAVEAAAPPKPPVPKPPGAPGFPPGAAGDAPAVPAVGPSSALKSSPPVGAVPAVGALPKPPNGGMPPGCGGMMPALCSVNSVNAVVMEELLVPLHEQQLPYLTPSIGRMQCCVTR
jgi:hypothetical protein